MTNDPNALMQAASCLRCVPKGMVREVQTYLLNSIANHWLLSPSNGSGTQWTYIPMKITDQFNGGFTSAFGGGNFSVTPAFGGASNYTCISPSAAALPTAWTVGPAGNPLNFIYYRMAYGLGRYVVVGDRNIMSSTDGLHWVGGTGAVLANHTWTDVAFGNGIFVAVANDGSAISADGTSWSSQAGVIPLAFKIAYGGGVFVATSQSGDVGITTNGVAWSTNGGGGGLYGPIGFGNGVFTAFQFSPLSNVPDLMYSSDLGKTWTLGSGPAISVKEVWFGNGVMIAGGGIGNNPRINRSVDGINWTQPLNATIPQSDLIATVSYGNGKFLACLTNYGTYWSV